MLRGLLDRAAARLGYARPMRRGYDAGTWSRLTNSWVGESSAINAEIFRSLRMMRARSREMAINDPYARRFLQMVAVNVIGNTFKFQSLAGDRRLNGQIEADGPARVMIEGGFADWSRRGVCELTGRMSFLSLLRLYARTLARDGEVLVRRVRDAQMNRYGYALQFIDIDRLDETYNDQLPNGNSVRMSVELDRLGRPVAYHILKRHPRDWQWAQEQERERVPATDVWHDFVTDSAEQIRGVPWMHAALIRMHHLGKFDEAAVIAARIGASELGLIQSPNGDPPAEFVDGKAASDGAAPWKFYVDVEPGKYRSLPPGYEFKDIPRPYPQQAYEVFQKACLRGVASGLGVSYNSLGADLEGVNYSSIRQGVLEERDSWMTIQGHVSDGFADVVARDWIEMSLAMRAVNLPLAKLEKFSAFTWQPRRWSWVDPKSDMEANVLAIEKGLKSRRAVIAEGGEDIDDVWSDLQAETAKAGQMGLNFTTAAKGAANETNNQPNPAK